MGRFDGLSIVAGLILTISSPLTGLLPALFATQAGAPKLVVVLLMLTGIPTQFLGGIWLIAKDH